jgi:hypothetical protein
LTDPRAKPASAAVIETIIETEPRAEDLAHLPRASLERHHTPGKVDIADHKSIGLREFPDARGRPRMGALALCHERLSRHRPRQPRQIAGAAGQKFVRRAPLQMQRDDDPLCRIDIADVSRIFGLNAITAGERDLFSGHAGHPVPFIFRRNRSQESDFAYRQSHRMESTRRSRPTSQFSRGPACPGKSAAGR